MSRKKLKNNRDIALARFIHEKTKGDIALLTRRFLRSASRPKAGGQSQTLGDGLRPGLASVRFSSLHRVSQAVEVAGGQWFVDARRPGGGTQRRFAQPQLRTPFAPRGETRPSPILRPLHQFGTQRVAFDVTRNGPQVIFILDRERLEAALPDVPGRAVMTMITPRVCRQEPLHPAPEVALPFGSDDQVERMGYSTRSEDVQWQPNARVGHRLDEGVVILRLVEDRFPPIPSVPYVVTKAPDRGPRGSWHAVTLSRSFGQGKKMRDLPLCFSRAVKARSD